MARKKAQRISKWLPVRLTRDETLERARTMSERLEVKKNLEAEKAATVRRFGEQLKELGGEIVRLGEIVRTGHEEREVMCVQELRDGNITITRTDTGEIIDSRKATADEKQTDIFEETEQF